MHAEAIAQALFEREPLWTGKSFPSLLHRLHPRGHEGADVLARLVEREEVPLAVDVREMIGINEARLGLLLAGFAIRKFKLVAIRHRLRQCVENVQIKNRLSAGAEGNR